MNAAKPHVSTHLTGRITAATSASFSSLFEEFSHSTALASHLSSVLMNCFIVLILLALQFWIPMRTKHHKLTPEPWLNNTIRTLRQAFRSAERK